MQRRAIADTGILVSPIGLGTVKLGRNQGVKYPRSFELPDDSAARALLRRARDLDINFLDTAPAYGDSEERLGKLLRGQRQAWVIATKVGEEFENGQSRFDFSAGHTRHSVERSLRRLNTDYLDLVLIHSDGDDERILRQEAVLETLAELRKAGWIRGIGMSTKTVAGGLLAAQHCDVVMATYNLQQRDEEPVLDACARLGKAVLVKKALGSGHLCAAGGSVEESLAMVYAHPGVSSVIIGTINPGHLQRNAELAAALAGCPGPGAG